MLVENWTLEKGRGVQGHDKNGLCSLGFDGSELEIHLRGFPLGRLFKPPPKTLFFIHIGQIFWGCPAQHIAVFSWDIVPRLGYYHPWGYNPQTRGGTGEQALPYTVMTCQKFCSVSRGNLIKKFFSSRSGEGISFFIMPPSCFVTVSALNFWFTWGKALGQEHYQNKGAWGDSWVQTLKP